MEKVEVKMREQCCLTCGKLYSMTCEDCLTYKCRKYEPIQPDKSALSTKYIEAITKLIEDVKHLQLLEMEMKIAEKTNLLSKIKEKVEVKEAEEKPAISKRNKEIIALVEQGKGVKEIAQELNLKPETVEKELEYLLKNRFLKEPYS
uniref:HTH luxR-type domain-containing protein n=1 Tax=Fervidobacterium pennivorans TaxID=93466 RepID=A0A7V4KF64_FERPE